MNSDVTFGSEHGYELRINCLPNLAIFLTVTKGFSG